LATDELGLPGTQKRRDEDQGNEQEKQDECPRGSRPYGAFHDARVARGWFSMWISAYLFGTITCDPIGPGRCKPREVLRVDGWRKENGSSSWSALDRESVEALVGGRL
jgi:hypothetical protein